METRTDEIIRSYKSGLSLRGVARAHKVSYERIRQILERENVPRRPQGATGGKVSPARAKLLSEIRTLVEKGLSFRQVAARLKISYQQVTYACSAMGVKSKYRTRYPQFKDRVRRLKSLVRAGNSINGAIRQMRREGDKITQKWVYDNRSQIWPSGKG